MNFSNTAAGTIASHAQVEKFCQDCGVPFTAPKTRARFMLRCPACQDVHRKELDVERWIRRRGGYKPHFAGGAYKIIHDPQESWSPGGSLDLGEIEKLVTAGYLDTGMRWSNGKRTCMVYRNRLIWEER